MKKPAIEKMSLPDNAKSRTAEAYVKAKHNLLNRFDSVDSLAVDGEEFLDPQDYRGLMHHLQVIRAGVGRTLWKNDVFVGLSVLDEFVFESARLHPGRVGQATLSALGTAHADEAGFVLYPLLGFGFEGEKAAGPKALKVFKTPGFAFCAQANSFETALENVSTMAQALGIKATLPSDDFAHHVRAGSMKWFASNPLLLVRVATHTGAYYENQFIYTLKIRLAATHAAMLSALSIEHRGEAEWRWSTTRVNRWQTLDIRHYLVAEVLRKPRRKVDIRRVPMNLAPLDLARLSDLPVTLNTSLLSDSRIRRQSRAIAAALDAVGRGYLSHVSMGSRAQLQRRVFMRIVTALDWYRRSFSATTTDNEAVVALAVAFETLLTDHYARGVIERVTQRIGICLKGRKGLKAYQDAVVSVMRARGEVVHNGFSADKTDVARARAAFALCVIAVSRQLGALPRESDAPIAHILKVPTESISSA